MFRAVLLGALGVLAFDLAASVAARTLHQDRSPQNRGGSQPHGYRRDEMRRLTLRRVRAFAARLVKCVPPLLMLTAGCALTRAGGRHPNFTGTWVLDPARSRLEGPAPDSTIFVIRHQEPAVRIFRTHARAGAIDTATVSLRTDSSEVLWELRGARVTSRSWWEGNELVFWSALTRGDQRASQVVRYSLSGDRRTFTAIETVDAGAASHVNRWVFDRRR